MWRVTFSLRTCLAFVLFSCVVLLYLHSTHTAVSSILHIRLYHSLDRYFLSKTCRTHKRCPVSLSGPERLYSPVPPRPACSRPPDLVTSNELEEPHHVFEGKARISRPVDRAGAHVLPRFSPIIQVAAAQTSESCQSYESKKMRDLCPGTTYPDWPSVAWSIFIILGDLADINGVHPL